MQSVKRNSGNVELARKCLRLIRDIADRCASSSDTEVVGYGLEELSQVLLERTGTEGRVFEPIPAEAISRLAALHEELEIVNIFSQDLCAGAIRARCN